MKKRLSKNDVIAAIHECARKLGRPPSLLELERLSGITLGKMRRHFQGIGEAIRAAGLEPNPNNLRTGTRALLTDWARVARKMRKLPSRDDYRRYGEHSAKSLFLRFGQWALLPVHFLDFARENGIEHQWQDVLGMIAHKLRIARTGQNSEPANAWSEQPGQSSSPAEPGSESTVDAGARTTEGGRATRFSFAPSHALFPGRPLAGGPLSLPGLSHEPANEAGVLFVFGMIAQRLGFRVISLQSAFPDCEAMRELRPGKWQRVRVEFEFESRNFKEHGHDPDLCDVIVCWRHNWAECPPQMEVVELSRMVGA